MLFFPFKVDLDLRRVPFATLLICALCLSIYYQQFSSERAVRDAATVYCSKNHEQLFHLVIEKVTGTRGVKQCVDTMLAIHTSAHPQQTIHELASNAIEFESLSFDKGNALINEKLFDKYREFRGKAPQSLTSRLMYAPRSFDVSRMISAAFSHGSVMHLLGNLFFFFAFAASVEIIIGSFTFIAIILSLAIATNTAYSLAVFTDPNALPTLGLSGVVMGMIGLFTFLMPTAKIRCLFWFILILRVFAVPAWLLALWYIGWDVLQLYIGRGQPNINLVAHVSGAAFGFLTGVLFFRNQRPLQKASGRFRNV